MTLEKRFSEKTYNETLLFDNQHEHPVQALGRLFNEENQKEMADLSYIRFAQGEVYYQYQDYETAIFKWENISNELEPWAKKNVGDAYFELGLYPTAIEYLKSVETDSLILQTEIALKLFEVYIADQSQELAVESIKHAVSIHPDYLTITEIARVYFEQNNDWSNAIELAVNESIRIESEYWFDILKGYIEQGYGISIDPAYFANVLEVMYKVDSVRFEKMVASLWKSYENDEYFIEWIRVINQLIKNIDTNESSAWHLISRLFQEAFTQLISGKFELSHVTNIMPRLLVNWTTIVQPMQALAAYSALISWNEFYSGTIKEETVKAVENKIWRCQDQKGLLDDSLHLFEAIAQWASQHKMEISTKMRWFVQEILDLHKQNIVVVGVNGTGKSTFINSVLGHEYFNTSTKNTVRIRNANEPHVTMISNEDIHSEIDVNDAMNFVNNDSPLHVDTILDFALPADVLNNYQMTLIDTPGFRGRKEEGQALDMLPLADQLLYIVDAEDPFTEAERDLLLRMKEQAPHLPVSFVVTKLDTIYNKQEAKKIVEDVYERIVQYEPNANVIAFSSKYELPGQVAALMDLFSSFKVERNHEKKRTNQLLQVIRRTIASLYKKRVEKEKSFTDAIAWNEDILSKLNASIIHLGDHKKDQIVSIRRQYRTIKDDLKEKMERKIPQIIRECADLLSEESDFRKIHVELNEEMNNRIQNYMENTLLPEMITSFHEWVDTSKTELTDSKLYMDEMAYTLNALYGEDKVVLQGDFKILEDWQRDIRRMTSGVIIERENILLRHTPSQILLKGAGKLLGALSPNKTMLFNQYKKFVEHEDYAETTSSIVSKFLLEFDAFERSIERDLTMFYNQPFDEMKQREEEAHEDIKVKEEALRVMRENPEIFDDAMTLFKIRLCQYEWMTNVGESQKVEELL